MRRARLRRARGRFQSISLRRSLKYPSRNALLCTGARKPNLGARLARFPNHPGRHKIKRVHVLSGPHHRISMYLAGILGLCALLHVSASGHVGGGPLSFDNAAASYQEPAQQPPKSDTPAHPSEAQPDARPTAPPQDQTQPPGAGQAPTASDSVKPPSADANAPPPKKSASRKKHSAGDGGEHQKKVIHRGGTVEPTTQLAQGFILERDGHQRETTN